MASSKAMAAEKTLSRKMTQMPTMVSAGGDDETADIELVPSSLASIVPILRVANEIEPLNPRVAYLCRFHAFEKAHNLDPRSSGCGVRRFKTHLLHRLERDEVETKPQRAKSDPREIQKFYQWYYENNVKEGPIKRGPEGMAKHYEIASVLYDVLQSVVPKEKVDAESKGYAKEVERKKVHFTHYNILPLHFTGAAPAIIEIPEIKAAVNALRKIDNLPLPRVHTTTSDQPKADGLLGCGDGDKSIHDLLDWCWLVFGFQVGDTYRCFRDFDEVGDSALNQKCPGIYHVQTVERLGLKDTDGNVQQQRTNVMFISTTAWQE